MPISKKIFIVSLVTFASCILYYLLVIILRELESSDSIPLTFLNLFTSFHNSVGIYIFDLAYVAGLLASGFGILGLVNKDETKQD